MIVKLSINSDGYVDGWGSDYTDDNQHDIAQDELDNLVIGATKLIDGHLVVDTAKQAELDKPAQADRPTDSASEIADLKVQLAQMQNAILELADVSLGGDANDASAS